MSDFSQCIEKHDKVTRIVVWNANGLSDRDDLDKRQELDIFLKEYSVDICLVSETHFTAESYMFLEGFKFYGAKHPSGNARGGSGILIRSRIKHSFDKVIEQEAFQAAVITVECPEVGRVNVASVYSPPKHNLKTTDYDDFFKQLGPRFLVGGDWNAKNLRWGSRLTLRKGIELESAVDSFNGNFLATGVPTYYPTDRNKIPDLLDFGITKGISFDLFETEVLVDELSSDHAPVLVDFHSEAILRPSLRSLVNNKTNWNGFREFLIERINLRAQLSTNAQIDSEYDSFIKLITEAARVNTPQLNFISRPLKITAEIRNLLREKKWLKRRWLQTRFPEHKTALNAAVRNLSRKLRKIKNEKLRDYLSSLTASPATDYSLWKATSYLKRPKCHQPPIRKADGDWAKTNEEKAMVFLKHLEKVFKPNEPARDTVLPQKAVELLQAYKRNRNDPMPMDNRVEDSYKIPSVSPGEVKRMIKGKVKVKKAPGFDRISGILLKELPQRAIMKIVQIFNAVLRKKYIPRSWKLAEVIMIHKTGKPANEAASYRPISLLPAFSKLFERIYIKRLRQVVEERNLIPMEQFGFRGRHSTVEQLHRVTNFIEEALEKKKYCVMAFLDVAQAFDRVHHGKLIEKLERMLPAEHVELLESYLSDRKFRVRFEDVITDEGKIEAGVPQGSVLGPLLFILFTSDIPKMGGNGKLALFADDTAIGAADESQERATNIVQDGLRSIQEWSNVDQTKLNSSKSVHIVFTNRPTRNIPLVLNREVLPQQREANYLGLCLDSKLRYAVHIRKKKKALNLKFNRMRWLFRKNSGLSIDNKLLLYRQILRPMWSYGCQLWGCARNSNLNIIQVFQNKVLRTMVGARWYERNKDIHRDLGIDTVVEHISKLAQNYENRLHCHPNQLALQLLDSSGLTRRLKRRKPQDLITKWFTKQ